MYKKIGIYDDILFSSNWNNKLNCNSFTTLRLQNDRKYYIGSFHNVYLNTDLISYCKVIGVKHIFIHEINEFIAQLDTGLTKDKCIELIKTFYKNKNIDWSKKKLSFILLTKIK